MSTATTHGARAHARAQAGTVVSTMATIPASAWPEPPDGVDAADLTWAEVVAPGGYATKVISAGTTLRLTDSEGEACAHLLLYNADQTWERLNVADSVKVPWQAYMTTGHPLLSDQGRALATLVADSTDSHHDALCGAAPEAVHAARYGAGGPWSETPAARELFKLAGAKHDLGVRDLAPSISFFKRVRVAADGGFAVSLAAQAGGSVALRAELPLLVLVVNAPHRLDERREYTCGPLELLAWRGEPTHPDDPLFSATPEAQRALWNSYDYATARGIRR
ncbi:MAG TPA: urea amidolyase associated protein UAAP1 [Solirubrobacteraceae bacterium]|nr:urea amidolyase associated protein UAAP1 [Solirubrobacteraceae bacterium]